MHLAAHLLLHFRRGRRADLLDPCAAFASTMARCVTRSTKIVWRTTSDPSLRSSTLRASPSRHREARHEAEAAVAHACSRRREASPANRSVGLRGTHQGPKGILPVRCFFSSSHPVAGERRDHENLIKQTASGHVFGDRQKLFALILSTLLSARLASPCAAQVLASRAGSFH